nr:PREDICTED: whey acidic protein-like isoform X2 [Anolis carolinensis]|eukprot:XP_016853603.1 PREDICTED: whey acidic protein-like isoform X2 [Anolis carolinensis]
MRICVQPAMVGLGYCPNLCPSVVEPCLVSCLDDTWCGPGEKCCQLDCHVRCVAAEPVRPGICPRKRILLNAQPCANQCVDDRTCPKGQKCCFTGCRLECVHPIAGTDFAWVATLGEVGVASYGILGTVVYILWLRRQKTF